jgi:DNA polymerase III subunit beta
MVFLRRSSLLFPTKGEGRPDALIPGFLLNTMLNKTLITVSTDQSKPAFTGVNFHMEGDILRLTSSDTFRLSMITDKIKDMHMEDTQFIVPAKSLRELMRVVKEHDVVSLTVVKGLAIFGFGETLLTTSLLADKFPNISRVIPTDAFTTVTVNKNLLEMALGRTSLWQIPRSTPLCWMCRNPVLTCILNPPWEQTRRLYR